MSYRYNNCNCNFNCENIESSLNGLDCVSGIRRALVVILEAFKSYSYYETDRISIEVTLSNGVKYPIVITMATLNSVCVKGKIATFGELAISLCDIAKIKVLVSQPINQNLIKCINSKLCSIANGKSGCSHNSAYDYLAITSDDCNNYNINGNCNCNCNANINCNDSYKNNDECCTREMQKAINCNKKDINSVGFNGGVQPTIVNSLKTIKSTTVLKSVGAIISTATITTNVSVVPSITKAINLIVEQEKNVVSAVTVTAATVVKDITVVKNDVLKSVNSSAIAVAKGINFLPSSTVVNKVNVETTTIITSVTPIPVTLVSNVSVGKTSVVKGSAITTPTVVSKVTTTTASVVTGIKKVSLVVTKPVTIPVLKVAGPFPATLVVVVDGVTSPVIANGVPVIIQAMTVVNVLPTPATILNVLGTPVVENIIKSVTATTVKVSNITSPTLVSVVNAATVTQSSAVKSLISVGTIGVKSVTPISSSVTLVNPKNPITTTTVSYITSQSTISAVTSVTPQYANMNEIIKVTSTTVKQILSVGSTTVVSGISVFKEQAKVVTGLSLITQSTTVVESITSSEVGVITPMPLPVNGNVLCVGNGIMVVQEFTGDICIYSTCEINSFSTTCR